MGTSQCRETRARGEWEEGGPQHSLNPSLGHSHHATPVLSANIGRATGKPLYITRHCSNSVEKKGL